MQDFLEGREEEKKEGKERVAARRCISENPKKVVNQIIVGKNKTGVEKTNGEEES